MGESYNVGARNERRNIDVVETICGIMDEFRPRRVGPHRDLITFVADRPGHDLHYAIDASKIERELGWSPLSNSKAVCARPSAGISTIQAGGRPSAQADIAASALAS